MLQSLAHEKDKRAAYKSRKAKVLPDAACTAMVHITPILLSFSRSLDKAI